MTTLKAMYLLIDLALLVANAAFAFMAAGQAKEGINCFDKRYQWNPLNLVTFHPEDLNTKGKKYRKIHFACLAGFALWTIAGLILHSYIST
ncbi:hypothetical protein [Pelagicoccus enzymogenes]|uniref:hypothetical protein n=1 Tax=Pelagicoccus enzymogenes TaxID=2773457 RepID=UPI001CD5B40E|nr:hypothetical protein [Pelagicoccus enzymogenes]